MSQSFKILVHLNSDNLHLKLTGDFDGTAAHELLDAIAGYGSSVNKIFIHTSGLESIHSEGRRIFDSGLQDLDRRRMVFTGPPDSSMRQGVRAWG